LELELELKGEGFTLTHSILTLKTALFSRTRVGSASEYLEEALIHVMNE